MTEAADSGDIYPAVYREHFAMLIAAGQSRIDAAEQACRIAARAEIARRDAGAALPR